MAPRPDSPFPRGGRLVWRAASPLARGLARWWVRYRRFGARPPSGPVVVAANHYSHVDPVVVGMALGRPIRYLAVDELFGRSRSFDWVTRFLGAIPMSRVRAPFGALKTALAEIAYGGTVGLFPEGARVANWGDSTPKRGAAWLARKASVPLVPVAIAGSDRVMGLHDRRVSRGVVTAVVCEPIDASGNLAETMAEWERRVGEALAWAQDERGEKP